jgi:CSLREA domain-containing protein
MLDGPGLIAAYEGALLFDTTALAYGGIEQPHDLATRLGREAHVMADVHFETGLTFGLFSPQSFEQRARISNESVRIASVYLKAEQAGSFQIALQNWRFLDAEGRTISVANDNAQFTIQIGESGDLYPAPQPAWHVQSSDALVPSQERLDVTGEGRVDLADALELALIWSQLRARQQPCALGEHARYDVNGDACVDIRDLQQVANNPVSSGESALVMNALTFEVNATSDAEDANKGDGLCRTAAGVCTLRAAIEEANRHNGPDRITFNIPSAQNAPVDIQVTSSLPIINDSSGGVTIDGYSQAGSQPNSQTIGGSNAVIRIQIRAQGHGRENLNGSGAQTTPPSAGQYPVFMIVSGNNELKGVAIYNMWRAFHFSGSASVNNKVVGSFIGTNAAGTYRSSKTVHNVNGAALFDSGASNNQIGDTSPADRVIASGSPGSGIYLGGVGTNYNRFYNIVIGLAPDGSRSLGNYLQGLDINRGASYNIVGGTLAGQRNWIGANGISGIEVSHEPYADYNQIIGNYIGVNADASGTVSMYRNQSSGIHIEDHTHYNVIKYNVIGNNQRAGIQLSETVTNNEIAYNYIGVTPSAAVVSNGLAGIVAYNYASNNTIGPANVIANNPVGVLITSSRGGNVYNRITQNSIYNNTTLGIDLGSTGTTAQNFASQGVTPNEQPISEAPNNNQAHPALARATPNEVSGLACAGCTVEVFRSDGGAQIYGEGRTYLGTAVADANGQFRIVPSGTLNVGDFVTATATNTMGDTSEFSLNRIVTAAGADQVGSVYGSDDFSQSSTSTWPQSDQGGLYSFFRGSYSSNGSTGAVTIGTGNPVAVGLLSTAVRDSDNYLTFSLSALPASGRNAYLYLVARRIVKDEEYRGKVRINERGEVFVQATYGLNGAEHSIGSEVRVQNLTVTPGMSLRMHFLVSGVNPTTLKMRVWDASQSEPSVWHYSASDATARLQNTGSFGMRFYFSAPSASDTLTFRLDNYLVTLAEDLSPPPTPTPSPTVASPTLVPTSVTASPTVVPTGGTGGTASPTVVPTGGTGGTASPTVVPTGGTGGTASPTPEASPDPNISDGSTIYLPVVRKEP